MSRTHISQDNIEEWLFEYCEGTLTSNEKMKVEAFIARHPEYQEELNFWKDSYLHKVPESALPKEAQELLKTSTLFPNNSSLLKVFAVVSTLAIILIITFTSQKDTRQNAHESENGNTHSTKLVDKKEVIENNLTDIKLAKKPIRSRDLKVSSRIEIRQGEPDFNEECKTPQIDPAHIKTDNVPQNSSEDAPIEIKSESATPDYIENVPKTTIISDKQEIEQNTKTKTKLSSAQKRRLAREIKKAQNKREQEQLMNGNKPYIVPSDPTIY